MIKGEEIRLEKLLEEKDKITYLKEIIEEREDCIKNRENEISKLKSIYAGFDKRYNEATKSRQELEIKLKDYDNLIEGKSRETYKLKNQLDEMKKNSLSPKTQAEYEQKLSDKDSLIKSNEAFKKEIAGYKQKIEKSEAEKKHPVKSDAKHYVISGILGFGLLCSIIFNYTQYNQISKKDEKLINLQETTGQEIDILKDDNKMFKEFYEIKDRIAGKNLLADSLVNTCFRIAQNADNLETTDGRKKTIKEGALKTARLYGNNKRDEADEDLDYLQKYIAESTTTYKRK